MSQSYQPYNQYNPYNQGNPQPYQQYPPSNQINYPYDQNSRDNCTSYPMGNVNPLDIQTGREYHSQGVQLSPNVKNCLIATAIISFLIFIFMLIF